MASSSNLSSDITALIVEFYEKKALDESEYTNDLLKRGVNGVIPEGNSSTIHWHKWSKFALADDLSTQVTEPSSGIAADASDIKGTLVEFGSYIDVPLFGDAIRLDSLIKESYGKFTEQAQRTANRRTMTRLELGSNSVTGNTFSPFTHMYCGGKSSFADLDSTCRFTNKDIQRAVAFIEQNMPPSGGVVCAMNPWAKADLMIDDANFRDMIKMNDLEILKRNNLPMWAGAQMDKQDEPWRETLGGSEGTYAAGGSVVTLHIYSPKSYGKAQLMGRTGLKPKFHVQNISKTGAVMSIGYRIPFQAAVLEANWGVCLKGVVRDATVSSVA